MTNNDLVEAFAELYPTALDIVTRPTESRLHHGSEAESSTVESYGLDYWTGEPADGFHTACLDYEAVERFRPELATRLRRNSGPTIAMARLAYERFANETDARRLIEATNFEVYRGPPADARLESVPPKRLCQIEGTVQDARRVELSLYEAAVQCSECGCEELVSVGTLDEEPPDMGSCAVCESPNPWRFEAEHSLYRPIQTSRVERTLESDVPAESVPVVLTNHLALGVTDGDEVTVTGVRCERSGAANPLTISGPYIHCSSIKPAGKRADATPFGASTTE
jgi:DNA replicative helicase MCM subunit Mcm2 (Cdc46/Mcm family)